MSRINQTGNKTKIKIRSGEVPLSSTIRERPVYEVPLQTRTTLNILTPEAFREKSNNKIYHQMINNNDFYNNKQSINFGGIDEENVKKKHEIEEEMKEKKTEEEGEEEEESDGEIDVVSLAKGPENFKSTFYYMSWELPKPNKIKEEEITVVLFKDQNIVVLLKVSCKKEKTIKSKNFFNLMEDISQNCAQRLFKLKSNLLPQLSPQHMDTLPLSDGKTTKVHLQETSLLLSDSILLTEVAYKFKADHLYIDTFVQDKIFSNNSCEIGKLGVVVVLSKKSKFATIEALSEQLCLHISKSKPKNLGVISEKDIKKINKNGTMKILHLQKDQLLLQDFSADPTIIVAEAARRSFVKIEDFLLFY